MWPAIAAFVLKGQKGTAQLLMAKAGGKDVELRIADREPPAGAPCQCCVRPISDLTGEISRQTHDAGRGSTYGHPVSLTSWIGSACNRSHMSVYSSNMGGDQDGR